MSTSVSHIRRSVDPPRVAPGSGESVYGQESGRLSLGSPVMSDRSSITYATNVRGMMAKVYTADTLALDLWENKVARMLRSPIRVGGICWPVDRLENAAGQFVGTLVPASRGVQLTESVLKGKSGLSGYFPGWTKAEIKTLSRTILSKAKALHREGVLFGCINPASIYVASPEKVYLVDADGWQVGGFPAISRNVTFTPPEVLRRGEPTLLFSEDQDNYQVAVLLSMLVMPGKFPYARRGGSDVAASIREMSFPFGIGEVLRRTEGSERPSGMWRLAWDNLPYRLCRSFYETFSANGCHAKEGTRLGESAWMHLVEEMGDGPIFPDSFRRDPKRTFVKCGVCGREQPDFYFLRRVYIKREPVDIWKRGYGVCLSCAGDQSDASFTRKGCGRTFYYTNGYKMMYEIGRTDFSWKEQHWCRDCKRKRATCERYGSSVPITQLRDWKGLDGRTLRVCRDCQAAMREEQRKAREAHGREVYRTLRCRDCGQPFSITNDEAAYYQKRGLNLPKRWKSCRDKRRNREGGRHSGA